MGCGAGRAQLFGAASRVFAGRLSEATRVPSLREIHVVTLFLLTSSPTRRDAVPGHLESDMTGIWARYQNRRDPVSLSLYLQVRDREGVPREAYQTERIAPEVYVKDVDLEGR